MAPEPDLSVLAPLLEDPAFKSALADAIRRYEEGTGKKVTVMPRGSRTGSDSKGVPHPDARQGNSRLNSTPVRVKIGALQPEKHITVPDLDPDERVERLLGEIALRRQQLRKIDEEVGHLVEQGREAGATWSEIGEAFEITAQSAHQKWSPNGRGSQARKRPAPHRRRPRLPDSDS